MGHFRLIALLVALTAALAVPAAGTSTPADQVRGPGCGDITLWDPDLSGPPVYRRDPNDVNRTPTVFGKLTTAKPSCGGATYTISVYDASGATLLGSQTFTGDDATSSFSFAIVPTGGPNQVCIAGTSARDGHVVDVAPNSGCFPLSLDSSPGGSGLN
jgi:hypothetical protein